MSQIKKLGFGILFFAIFFGVFGSFDVNAQGPLTEILNRMEKHRNVLDTLKSNVEMAKTDSLLDETDITVGYLSYIPKSGQNDLVRIEWIKPVNELLVVAKGKYLIYRPRLKQAIRGEINRVNGVDEVTGGLDILSMPRKSLKANYIRQYVGRSRVKGKEVSHIYLKPKKRSKYKSVDIYVDDDGMLLKAKVIEKNNDSTVITLYNIVKNSQINLKIFDVYTVPKGTKILKG